MTKVVISASQVSKKYRLGKPHSSSLRESIAHAFKSNRIPKERTFWALKDINFQINRGEIVGIIGKNGAGKSTLLKILSRITPPTKGTIKLTGRLASLLEVGTGFHPELTGRENIFLNGTILGMRKAEIREQLDEIVEFSGVAKFLDTPVKHYSSGMFVRLAFAVAAHLNQEILVVDEVLAVGDAAFQKKCLGKMEDISQNQNRTILFVSHQMNSVSKLCNRGMFLSDGELIDFGGDVQKCIDKYYNERSGDNESQWISNKSEEGSYKYFQIERFQILKNDLTIVEGTLDNSSKILVNLKINISQLVRELEFGIILRDEANHEIFRSFYYDNEESKWPTLVNGENDMVVEIPARLLNEGKYYVELISGLRRIKWYTGPGAQQIIISFAIKGGLSNSPIWHEKRSGILAPVLNWRHC